MPPPQTQTQTQVKRERSPTPPLDDAPSAPRLVTEGCVRIAPLPPECGSRQPDFRGARQRLVNAEVLKLRERGLFPTRVFTRDDGMVIDWYGVSVHLTPSC